MAFQPNARRAAIIVCNFWMPDAAFKSENLVSFSMFQAPSFVTVRPTAFLSIQRCRAV